MLWPENSINVILKNQICEFRDVIRSHVHKLFSMEKKLTSSMVLSQNYNRAQYLSVCKLLKHYGAVILFLDLALVEVFVKPSNKYVNEYKPKISGSEAIGNNDTNRFYNIPQPGELNSFRLYTKR